MSQNHSSALLPSGFADLLPPDARRARLLFQRVLDSFAAFGYQEITPPLMEFETSLLAAKGSAISNQTFRLMDPISREMMGLRTDMTMQIARIASSRLLEEPKPLRLCYGGTCLRVMGEGLRKERQFVQAGAELIGSDTALADSEIIRCAVAAIAPLGLGKITVDINLPGLADRLLDLVSEEQRPIYKHALANKDRAELESLPEVIRTPLLILLESNAYTSGDKGWQKALNALPEELRPMLEGWLRRVSTIEKSGITARISLDPLEYQGFEYHQDIAFSIFASDVDSEIGRGGRYLLNDETPAVGFTLFLNHLRNAAVEEAHPMICYIMPDAKEDDVERLRGKGWVTIYCLNAEIRDSHSAAIQAGCTHILEQGNLLPLHANGEK